MGRRGGSGSGGGGGGYSKARRQSLALASTSTLSPAVINSRITACKISHLSSDDIAEHLYSAYPDYKHYKLIPFRHKIKQILLHEDEDEDEEVSIDIMVSPHRKRHRRVGEIDRQERLLLERENAYLRKRRYRTTTAEDEEDVEEEEEEESVSTSEDAIYGEDIEPKFDLMKNMLRDRYGGSSSGSVRVKQKGNSKGKEEEENLEVEDVRREKETVTLAANKNSGGSEVVEEREQQAGGAGAGGVRFKDLGGMKHVLDQLRMEVIVPLYHPQLSLWLGVKPMAGILLHGPPGCGKTKLAHAIANETGVPFYQISATEIVSGVSGASEENIRELFSKAYRTAPSIVFIDEIDAIASKRENLQREMERRIVTQLITCMDESHMLVKPTNKDSKSEPFPDKKSGYVLVIGATNRPDAVDSALRRPGRFDREIALGVPDENARVEILSVLTQNLRLAGDFDLLQLARGTPGFVGADLAALANKAGNLAMKRIIDQRRLQLSKDDGEQSEQWWREPWSSEEMENLSITMADFEEAVGMVQPSSRREGFSAIPNVKWEDVGGLNLLREEFERYIVRRIKYPKAYEKFGVDLETGFLLYGPPGCGKTLIAKAVANEAGANFIHIKGPELLNKYVGESELHVRTIFSRARTCAPCILFFDEVDALTTKRGKEGGWVVERLLNQLMIELDGAEQRRGVFVIGATNRPEVMDPAVRRPGRFGKLLYVSLPSAEERGLILKALSRRKPIDESVDLLALGKSSACENLSGADLAALMNEAAMIALEEKLVDFEDKLRSDESSSISNATPFTITRTHFERALMKVTPSVSEKQKKYYEQLSLSFRAA